MTELEKTRNLYFQKVKPALGQKTCFSDEIFRNNWKTQIMLINTESLSIDEMKGFLTIAKFIREQEEEFKENPKFKGLKDDFYESANMFFLMKITKRVCDTKDDCYCEIERRKVNNNDLDYILSLKEEQMPLKQILMIIPLVHEVKTKPLYLDRLYSISYLLSDSIQLFDEQKRSKIIDTLTTDTIRTDHISNYISPKDFFDLKKNTGLLSALYDYLDKLQKDKNTENKAKKLKEYIKTVFFPEFNNIIDKKNFEDLKSPRAYRDGFNISDVNIMERFIAKFFVEDLIKADKLTKFLLKRKQNLLNAKDPEHNIFVTRYQNLNSIINMCDCNIENVRNELKEAFINVHQDREDQMLQINEEYENIDYRP